MKKKNIYVLFKVIQKKDGDNDKEEEEEEAVTYVWHKFIIGFIKICFL